MRAARTFIWGAVLASAVEAVGQVMMTFEGYDYASLFPPPQGGLAESGLLLVGIGAGLGFLLILASYVAVSVATVNARARIGGTHWKHSAGAVWGWWLVPIASLWIPRSVYLEVSSRARPEDPDLVQGVVNQWWGWFLAFWLVGNLELFPVSGGAWFVVIALSALFFGIMAARSAMAMLDFIAEPIMAADPGVATFPMRGTEPTSPGWYYDPSGRATHQAYWDGQRWTGATRDDPHGFPSENQLPRPMPGWAVVLIVIGLILIVGALAATGFFLFDSLDSITQA